MNSKNNNRGVGSSSVGWSLVGGFTVGAIAFGWLTAKIGAPCQLPGSLFCAIVSNPTTPWLVGLYTMIALLAILMLTGLVFEAN